MAGLKLKSDLRKRPEVAGAFRRLLDAGVRPQPALKNIGIALIQSTRRRFAYQEDPDGRPWKPLNPAYAAGKRTTKILQELGMRGGLLGSINWRLDGRAVVIGTIKKYARIHQLGGVIRTRQAPFLRFMLGNRLVLAKQVTIPARPFLGVSDSDVREMADILADHLQMAMKG